MRALGAVAATGICAVAAHAQPVVSIAHRVVCQQCAISVGPERVLGDDDRGALSRAPIWMAGDRAGFAYVLEEVHEGGPHAYDSTGSFVRTLGAVGSGPGEYRLATAVIATPESLWVFDARAARRSRHAPAPQWAWVRSDRTATHWHDVLVLDDGRTVLNSLRSGGSGVQPLHILAPDGTTERSFGWSGDPVAQPAPQLERVLAAVPGGFLAAHAIEYRIDDWTTTGQLRRVLRRDAPWFVARTRDPGVTETQSPLPRIRAVRVDARGRVWVLLTRAGPEWRRGVGEPSVRMGNVTGWTLLDRRPQVLYESVIEVIDPARGDLLASTVVPGYFPWFVGAGRIGGYRVNDDGVPIPVTRSVSLLGAN